MNVQEKRKKRQWLWPLLFVALLVGGTACSDDDKEERDLPKYQIIELNMEDHRFEDLETINIISDALCREFSGDDLCSLLVRNDSVFINYYGTLLYPTRLPADFTVFGNSFIFSGTVKKQIENTDYYPLVLGEFKYGILIQM